jgi:hypothetical protein
MLKSIEKEMNTVFSEADVFFIDANVLIFLYAPISEQDKQKSAAYSNFIQKLNGDACRLCISTLNAQEVFHVIERIHCGIYRSDAGTSLTIKEYRKIHSERIKLAGIQQTAWKSLKEIYEIVQEQIDSCDLSEFTRHYENHRYEPIDYIVKAHHTPLNIITDDRDFAEDENVAAYTFLNDDDAVAGSKNKV